LAVDNPPGPFVQFLAHQSEGNPFFVAEYLRSAVDEGIIRRLGARSLVLGGGAEASIDALRALPFPATLREVVGKRLSGLSPQGQRRVELAAVIGREFDVEILDAAGGVDDSSTAELLSRQIVEQVRQGALRFAHDKLREIAYERIDPERRGALHLSAAEAIVSVRRGRPDFAATSGVLAHHYLLAGRTGEAVDHLEKAGVRALGLLAVQALRARVPPGARSRKSQNSTNLHLELARAHRHVAVVHYFQNEAVPVVVRLIDAVEHAERAGPSPELSGAYAEIGG